MLLDSYIVYFIQKELDHGVQKILLVFCCALLTALLLQFIIKSVIEITKLPPGPFGVFPFGILKFIGEVKHTEFMKLASTYGPLFSCKLGLQLHVVISDYKLIREILKKESVTDRPKTPLYAVLNGAGKLIDSTKRLRKVISVKFFFVRLSTGKRTTLNTLRKLTAINFQASLVGSK